MTAVDFETLRGALADAIPFNVHVGLEVVEIAPGRGVVVLPDADHLNNDVGSQHAGALFSAAEAASGAAFLGAFADRLTDITPLARAASIEYLKIAHGPITATATLDEDAEALMARLDADGRVQFPVGVVLTDEQGTTVAQMTVDWHVRKNA